MYYEKDIILFIDNKIIEKLIKCVEKAAPNEACGLIFGNIEEKKKSESEDEYSYYYNAYIFECIESSHKSPVSFLMDDYEKLIKLSNSHKEDFNYQLLSVFHSHPGTATPSGIDLPYMESYYKSKLAKFKYLLWTIMNAENKELNGFIFLDDELKRILVKIREK
jgi:proteasome lid subunit RPN8/RPN11